MNSFNFSSKKALGVFIVVFLVAVTTTILQVKFSARFLSQSFQTTVTNGHGDMETRDDKSKNSSLMARSDYYPNKNQNMTTNITNDMNTAFNVDNTFSQANNCITKITMILKLSGELGNNLMCLIGAYLKKWWFEESYPGIEIDIVGQHQDADKWTRGQEIIQQCLINFRTFDFEGGIWDEYVNFTQLQLTQGQLLAELEPWNKDAANLLDLSVHNISQAGEYLQKVLRSNSSLLTTTTSHRNVNDTHNCLTDTTTSTTKNVDTKIAINSITNRRHQYSVPYLTMKFSDFDTTKVPKNRLKELLAFDYTNPNCCSDTIAPDPDETVFHLRNFISESLWLLEYRIDFHEITPNQIVPFFNLKQGDKLAILGRYIDNEYAQRFLKALNETQVQVRLIRGQTPQQDFCFLLRTQKELIATEISTFARMASTLADIPTTLYSISPTETYNGTNLIPLSAHPRSINSSAPFIRYVKDIPNANCRDDDGGDFDWKICPTDD